MLEKQCEAPYVHEEDETSSACSSSSLTSLLKQFPSQVNGLAYVGLLRPPASFTVLTFSACVSRRPPRLPHDRHRHWLKGTARRPPLQMLPVYRCSLPWRQLG